MQKILKLGYDISQKEKEIEEEDVVDSTEEKLKCKKSMFGLEKEEKVEKEEEKEEEKKIGEDLRKVGSIGSMFKKKIDLNLNNYYDNDNDNDNDRVLYDEEMCDHELFSDEVEVMKKNSSIDSNLYENYSHNTQENLYYKSNVTCNLNDGYYNSNENPKYSLNNNNQKDEIKQLFPMQKISKADSNPFRVFKNGRSYSQSTLSLSSSPPPSSSSSSSLLPMKSTSQSAFISVADDIHDTRIDDNTKSDQLFNFQKDIEINDKMRQHSTPIPMTSATRDSVRKKDNENENKNFSLSSSKEILRSMKDTRFKKTKSVVENYQNVNDGGMFQKTASQSDSKYGDIGLQPKRPIRTDSPLIPVRNRTWTGEGKVSSSGIYADADAGIIGGSMSSYFDGIYYPVLYCTVLYCTVLYCTVLY